MAKTRKTMAVILAVLLMATLSLTACSDNSSGNAATTAAATTSPAKTTAAATTSAASATTAAPAVTEPAKLTMFMGTAGIGIPDGVDIADNPYINKIQELANVEITELTVPPYTDFATRLTLMLSSNTIPDLVHSWQQPEIGKAGAAGAFMELSDVINNSAVLSSTYDDEMRNLMKYSDGNIYYIRTLAAPDPGAVGIRYDLINEINGGVIPETVDDWYEVFKKLKTAYPDSIPISDYNGIGSTLRSFFRAYGVEPTGWQYTFGEYIHCFEATYCKDAILFVKKLYDEGLLSKTFVTNTQQDYANDKLYNKVIYYGNNYASCAGAVNKDDPSQVTVPTAYPTTGLDGIDPINAIPNIGKLGWGHNIAVSAKTKELDGCVRLIEVLLSDDVAELSVWGLEGVDYEVQNNQKVLLPAANDHAYRRIFGFMFTYNTADAIANNITTNLNAYVTDEALKTEYRAAMDAGKERVFNAASTVPSIKATDFVKLDEDYTNKVTEATELAKTIILRAITGEISMDEYETQVAEFLTKYQPVTDEYNRLLADAKTTYGYN